MNKLSWVPIRFVIILAILGVFLTYEGIKTISIMSKEPVDIMALDSWDELEENMHIECDIPTVWDAYISTTTENKTFGVTTSTEETSRSYLIPHLVEDRKSIQVEGFISYSTTDYDLMNKMIAESDDWWNDTTGRVELETSFHVDGYLAKLSSKESELMRKYLLSSGLSVSDLPDYMYEYKIMHGGGVQLKTGYIELVGSIMCYIVIALIIFFAKRKHDQNNMVNASLGRGMEE